MARWNSDSPSWRRVTPFAIAGMQDGEKVTVAATSVIAFPIVFMVIL